MIYSNRNKYFGVDGESICKHRSKRAAVGESAAAGFQRKTLRSLRKKAVCLSVEPHVRSRNDFLRGLETINLGGIAEDVFRPMWAAGVFFVFDLPR